MEWKIMALGKVFILELCQIRCSPVAFHSHFHWHITACWTWNFLSVRKWFSTEFCSFCWLVSCGAFFIVHLSRLPSHLLNCCLQQNKKSKFDIDNKNCAADKIALIMMESNSQLSKAPQLQCKQFENQSTSKYQQRVEISCCEHM